jgi:hypothetical protein
MDDDQSKPDEFAEIVHASLSDVDTRPVRLKVLDWALVIAMIAGIALIVGFLLGACVWIWAVVAGKF